MRRFEGAGVGALAALVATGVMAGAGAAAAPSGGPIALSAGVGSNPTQKIVVAGAIGDWGTVHPVDRSGKPDQNGNFVKVLLKKGSFELDVTAVNKAMSNPRPQVQSDVTCSVAAVGSGAAKLFDGTGLYKGISGTVNVTITFTGVGGRYQSGAKKGQCSRGGEPLAMLGSVVGHGTVRFSG